MASAPTRQDESQDLDVEKAENHLLSFAAFSELPKSALFCRVFTFLALTVALASEYVLDAGIFGNRLLKFKLTGPRSFSGDSSLVKKRCSTRPFKLDIIVSVYDENPERVLRHLETCCFSRDCRVWLYSAFESGVSERSHELQSANREVHEIEDWLSVNTTFEKHGARVNNSWTGTESTAYVTHAHVRYDDLADKVAFVQGHISSWHSAEMCDTIRSGVSKVEEAVSRDRNESPHANSSSVYININKPYSMRCISRTGVSGPGATESLRDSVYENWKKWTGDEPPERMTWECCAQFVTTRESLRARSRVFWKNLYDAMPSTSSEKIPWEYLWPTFVDEAGSSRRGSC